MLIIIHNRLYFLHANYNFFSFFLQYDPDVFLTCFVKFTQCLMESCHWCKSTGNALVLLWLVGDNDQMHIKISSTWLWRSLLPRGYMQDGDCGRWSVIYSFSYTSNNRRRRRLTANGTLASSRPAVTGITRMCLIWHTHILPNKELGWSASLCRDERDRELMIGWALMLNMQSGRIWYRTQKIFDMNGLLLLGSY